MGLASFKRNNQKLLKDAVVNLGDNSDLQIVPSNIIPIDYVLNGGLARGKIVEIAGEFQAGKTTLALTFGAAFQKRIRSGDIKGGIVIADFEHALSPTYAKTLGMDIEDEDSVMWLQPTAGADELSDILDGIYKENDKTNDAVCSLLIIDSLAAMRPKSDIENTLEDSQKHKGSHARMVASFLAKHTPMFNKHDMTVIIINQTRKVIHMSQYTPKEDKIANEAHNTTGGKSAKFFFFNRIFLKTEGVITEKKFDKILGKERNVAVYQKTLVENIKDKKGIPFKKDIAHIRWGIGYSNIDSIVEKAIIWGFIKKEGQFYSIEDTLGEELLKVRGKDSFIEKITNPDDDTTVKAAISVLATRVKEYYKELEKEESELLKKRQESISSLEDMLKNMGRATSNTKLQKVNIEDAVDDGRTKKEK